MGCKKTCPSCGNIVHNRCAICDKCRHIFNKKTNDIKEIISKFNPTKIRIRVSIDKLEEVCAKLGINPKDSNVVINIKNKKA